MLLNALRAENIDRQLRPRCGRRTAGAGAQQQRCRSTALSSKCGQRHVDNRRTCRRLNRELFLTLTDNNLPVRLQLRRCYILPPRLETYRESLLCVHNTRMCRLKRSLLFLQREANIGPMWSLRSTDTADYVLQKKQEQQQNLENIWFLLLWSARTVQFAFPRLEEYFSTTFTALLRSGTRYTKMLFRLIVCRCLFVVWNV